MAITAAQRTDLRDLCNLDVDDATYTEEKIDRILARHPLVDSAGYEPGDDEWTDTYNLNAAAIDICLEQLAATDGTAVDMQADGAMFTLSQEARNLRQRIELLRAEADKGLDYFPL